MRKKILMGMMLIISTMAFTACGGVATEKTQQESTQEGSAQQESLGTGNVTNLPDTKVGDDNAGTTTEGTVTATAATTPILTQSMTQSPATSTTSAPSSELIGEAKAREIALTHANLKEADVNFIRVELENDDHRREYEIEFYQGNKEYDYEIDAYTGELLSVDYDVESFAIEHHDDATESHHATENVKYIGKEKVKELVLEHAGVKESDIHDFSIELEDEDDHDDDVTHYEVEFHVGNVEYNYEIEATKGSVLKYEKEIED